MPSKCGGKTARSAGRVGLAPSIVLKTRGWHNACEASSCGAASVADVMDVEHAMRTTARTRSKSVSRGFTLIELLTVVAMVGILATLGVVTYRKYLTSAASSEATTIMQSIRAAEDMYRSQALLYLGCSGCGGTGCAPGAGSLSAYYPQTTGAPNDKRWGWSQPNHPDYVCWRLLNVSVDAPVRFGFSVVAGTAGQAFPVTAMQKPPVWQPTDEPWYVIQATADRDANGLFAVLVTSSFASGDGSGVFSENLTE